MSKAGFIALIGRPNAGKSTLLNALVNEHLALTSHKAHATRKALKAIVPYTDSQGNACQMVFVDTPGIASPKKLLEQAMQEESMRALQDCDLVLFLASVHDDLRDYENFLSYASTKPHILALNKIDTLTHADLLAKIAPYQAYSDKFHALVPLSASKYKNIDILLANVAELLPESPFYYDPQSLSDAQIKEIYAEMIREQLFVYLSEEIPYASAVVLTHFKEEDKLDRIKAQIVVEKESQKKMIIGKEGNVIKKIGRAARLQMESLGDKKVFLQLEVVVCKNWSREREGLKKMGYVVE
ncbi:GTPase Era [Helicobacter cynogastricus]|uniref:GTPase Era n=1 Tax=Helicobacter cynogastricus TaxID=329937 RepID=UPI000CF023CB|nr:GTPase Era [Helicobacter cynogastricus]